MYVNLSDSPKPVDELQAFLLGRQVGRKGVGVERELSGAHRHREHLSRGWVWFRYGLGLAQPKLKQNLTKAEPNLSRLEPDLEPDLNQT